MSYTLTQCADGYELETPRLRLLPYRREYVPVYHAWMDDPWIREMTASERLSLEEEYEAQKAWQTDPSKRTFIVFAKEAPGGVAGAASPSPAFSVAPGLYMCGDVNLFLLDDDASADYAPPSSSSSSSSPSAAAATATAAAAGGAQSSLPSSPPPKAAEIMVMIADPQCRRKGYAREAVEAMMWFGQVTAGITRFVAKISDANEASLALFRSHLQYDLVKKLPHFEETHLSRDVAQNDQEGDLPRGRDDESGH